MNMIGKEILNYRIISEIGRGAMGVVYLAEHKNINTQKAAVKVINADMANGFTRKMLKDEAEHLAGLHHHNIVSFLDFHIDKEGNIYLIMEYAEGESLESYIKNVSGLIVEDRICPLFEPILDGVGYAHKKGILHRDIKPANIVIATDGTPKILDFGIAKIINKNANDEPDSLVMGTPAYMSPEQVKGEGLDERSDIYSLGVLLHQMLTGNAPYDTTTLTEQDINQKVVEEPLPRMRTYYKYVSDKVQAVVDKATAKNPDDRYQSCEEFKKALHNAIYPWKPKTWMKFAAAAVLALLIGTGFYVWDYNRTKVKYYKDYVEVWGVPQGVHKLSKNEVEHRTDSYRMEFRQRKLLRISHINSKGSIIAHNTTDYVDRPADSRYYYNEDGGLDYVNVYDEHGKLDMVKDYNKDHTVVIFRYGDSLGTEKVLRAETIGTFTASSKEWGKRSRISRYILSHDKNGYVTELRYAGYQNIIVHDEDGLYGRKYKLDDKGRVIEETFINQDGELIATKYGMGIRRIEYNAADDPVKFYYLTPDGNPSGEKGLNVPVVINEVDKWGNTVKQSYEDMDGNPVFRSDMCVAFLVYKIENGANVYIYGKGTKEEPVFFKGEGYSSAAIEYDENGFQSRLKFFDTDGNPTLNAHGVFMVEAKNDIHGNILELWNYNIEGNLTLANNDEGFFSGYQATYDSIGNQTSIVMYNTDKQPVTMFNGTAGTKMEYDEFGHIIKQVNIGVDLLPCYSIDEHIAVYKCRHDRSGNLLTVRYYTPSEDTLAIDNMGIAGYNNTYDERGNRIEQVSIGVNGRITNSPTLGFARITWEYDQNDNMIRVRYYNANGSLVMVGGDAGSDYIYDNRGNIVEEKPIDTKGNLAPNKKIFKYKYDGRNRKTEKSAYLGSGSPTSEGGIHKYTYQYDERNNITETKTYDIQGNLAIGTGKYAIVRNEYDKRGLLVKQSCFGINGNPVRNSDGYSIMVNEYNQYGWVIKQKYYDIDGNPTSPQMYPPVGIIEYDNRWNPILVAAQDTKGHYITFKGETWAIRRMKYDDKSKQIEDAYFDSQDKPILNHGYHIEKTKYDNFGRMIEQSLYDTKNKPSDCEYGFQKCITDYLADGKPATRKYYRANGALLATERWNGYEWELVQRQFDWREHLTELNRECPLDFGADAMHLTMQHIRVTGDRDCEIRFIVPNHAKNQLSSEQMNALKQTVQQITKYVEEQLNHKPYVTGNLYDKNGTSLYSVRI